MFFWESLRDDVSLSTTVWGHLSYVFSSVQVNYVNCPMSLDVFVTPMSLAFFLLFKLYQSGGVKSTLKKDIVLLRLC